MWPFQWTSESGFSASSSADDVLREVDGTGLTAVVTGASSGIGLETARALSKRGVNVIMGVRSVESGKTAQTAILKENPSGSVDVMELDLSSMDSVRNFASNYISKSIPLNILINNAGIMAPPFKLSREKIEMQFATNHIGHFLLTNLLLGTMKKTAIESNREGRVVNVSSEAHRLSYFEGIRFDQINDQSSYNNFMAYNQSKLANVLHANELGRRLKDDESMITANSLHPGAISSNLFRDLTIVNSVVTGVGKLVLKNVQQGAATTCYVAMHPKVKGISGKYFSDSNVAEASALGKNALLAKRLWDFSTKLVR